MDSPIDIQNIAGTAEIALRLGCPKQQIHALRKRADFPKPFMTLLATPLWDLQDIDAFLSTWKRRSK
jgi:predicted DNA-binding transcriptional regulator AlpA